MSADKIDRVRRHWELGIRIERLLFMADDADSSGHCQFYGLGGRPGIIS
ncbi:hypothetical protein [Microbacterium sp. LMC-P-041]|nr:hypothetical protein [Microbacterium sp. LMC-P-041]